MRRRIATLMIAVSLLSLGLVLGQSAPVIATPVATNDALYQLYGRAFPDPHGCTQGAPATSPWAKGNVCAVEFVQWEEAVQGLEFLETKLDRYLDVLSREELRQIANDLTDEELESAGLPREDLTRDKRDLYVIKVTDSQSAVPESRRRHFAYSLSIHGVERAGLEGGIRAIEDLATWAACEQSPQPAGIPACATEGPFPKQILEPFDTQPANPTYPPEAGPTAGEVLRNGVIYFVFANPDGWQRGEYTDGGVYFQRYNGNGMDLNRDWATVGYTEAQYTPFSEPETRGYAKFLRAIRARTAVGRFEGAIDLHGMLTAPSFSFTLLGAGQRDYRKNQLSVETSILTFRDSERRLAWSPLIAPAEDCPGPITEPVFDGKAPMCSDQWGTVWDTINYQVTGSFGDWMDSPIGLNAVGIDNEMALSHLTPNTVFDPGIEQAHIDGNKGLIYSQIAALLRAGQKPTFRPSGRVAYIFDPDRLINKGGRAESPIAGLPTQDPIEVVQPTGIQEYRFEVKGPADGVYNGGLSIEATFGNARGVSTNSAGALILDYCGPGEHPGEPDGECREVARYFNQSALYLQAGARIDLNDPRPGPYRIRANSARIMPTRYLISFSRNSAYPEPEQRPYNVSRMDFFKDLNRYIPTGQKLVPVSVDRILTDPAILAPYDTVVAANDFMPGFVAAGEPEFTGDPQAGETFAFPTGAAPGSDETYEFQVLGEPEVDNDQMVVTANWEVPSDYDVHVERQDADGSWQESGCECSFVANGEQVTVFDPEPGQWRIRLHNFAATPQPVEGTIAFTSLPAPPPAPPSRYTVEQFESYAGALAQFAGEGGNLVLTDAALSALPSLTAGIEPGQVTGGFFYAGWMDFDDGNGPTYDRHPLARAVNKEGTAEGVGTVDGQTFDNRHQSYEPVPIGYYVSASGSANANCDSDRCDSPNWIVDQAAWEAAGGTTAARTLVRETVSAGSPSHTGTSLGELEFGQGAVRIAGSVLPDPTEENYHPFGLFSYALTYTGYQVFENLVDYQRA